MFDDKRMPYKAKVTDTHVLGRHPDLQGSPASPTDYLMLRGIFMAAGRDRRSRSRYYVDLLKKVRETPEWKEFMEKGAFNHDLMTGDEYAQVAREGRSDAPAS